MYTSFIVKANELDEKFLKSIKTLFKSKTISIPIEDEPDTTEYLLSTEANRKHLKESLAEAKKGKLVKVSIDKL